MTAVAPAVPCCSSGSPLPEGKAQRSALRQTPSEIHCVRPCFPAQSAGTTALASPSCAGMPFAVAPAVLCRRGRGNGSRFDPGAAESKAFDGNFRHRVPELQRRVAILRLNAVSCSSGSPLPEDSAAPRRNRRKTSVATSSRLSGTECRNYSTSPVRNVIPRFRITCK